MVAVPVPSGLRDRIHDRRLARRRVAVRRSTYQLLAAAASVFVAVALGFGVVSATRQPPDLDKWAQAADEQFVNPDEAARLWLEANRLPAQLPVAFDHTLAVFRGTERVQGRDVPVMVFRDRDPHSVGLAKVYFLRDGEFARFKGLADAQASHFRTTTVRDDRNRLTIVVLHTGQDLAPFLRPDRSAGL